MNGPFTAASPFTEQNCSYITYLVRKIQHLLIPHFSFLVLLSIPVYAMLNNLGIESMITRFAVALLLPLLLPITLYKNIN